ncbi:Conserved_hypothetical protein [Hexamita inflata]|uniref:Uncharacterized protein n=1 Tax=Hexamita inflata TaxID=28002 RepID=A0AA86N469_9EUKA|nr:Conserved hypothetical protein [Hexamita inflata]
MNNSINKIKKFFPPPDQVSQQHQTHWEHIYQDSEIIRIFTHAVQTVEGDFVDLLQVKRTVDNIIAQLRAIKNMEGNQPSRVTFMLDILEERQEKSMSSHYQIADFLQVLDPQSPDTFQEFREKCMSTGLLMNNQYLKGGALELYKQRNTRIMVERAIVIGTKLGNKFDNYIHYLEHVWQDNPMIMDFLQQVAVLASSSASIERVFSFFHRQTSYFLRRAISSATLSSMAYIYIEEILEEMHQWNGKNYIRSGLDKFLYDEIDLLPDLQEEQEEHAQNEQAEEENNMNEESDWIHGDFQPDE